eukprot:1819310-Heterocapsa_arctica.AAC.1
MCQHQRGGMSGVPGVISPSPSRSSRCIRPASPASGGEVQRCPVVLRGAVRQGDRDAAWHG